MHDDSEKPDNYIKMCKAKQKRNKETLNRLGLSKEPLLKRKKPIKKVIQKNKRLQTSFVYTTIKIYVDMRRR